MRWVGLDVHHLYVHVTELAEDGTVKHYREELSAEGRASLKRQLGPDAHVVMEASGQTFRLHDELMPHAKSVTVAHPAQTRGASALHVKTDARDAEILARLLASGFIRPVWVPRPEVRALRGLMEYRCSLSTLHTATVNRVYASLRGGLVEYPKGLSSRRRDALDRVSWPEAHVELMVRSLGNVERCLKEQLRQVDAALEEWNRTAPDALLLQTIPGVGPVLAAALLSEIGDISRFPSPARLCAYAGLVPRVHASGKTLHIGRLAHRGRHLLRWATWMATLGLVRRDGRFQEFYVQVGARRSKQVARVACCRKLLTVIWHMLRRGQPFRRQELKPS